MKFILLCYDDPAAWDHAGEAALQAAMQQAVRLTHELHGKGQYVVAAPLHPAPSATVVRIREGKRIVTDGPFAETREVLGGFYVIDVNSREEALAVAERHPGAAFGTVEIRPILELPNLPGHKPPASTAG